MNGKNWPQQLKDKNHFLLAGQPFCYYISWCGDTQKRHLGFFVHPLITQRFYCGQHCTQECGKAHIRWMLPLVFLAWETFWESYSAPPQGASEEQGKSNNALVVRNQKSIWDAIRSTLGAPPPCLGGRTQRDDSETPVSVKDRLTPAREGSLVEDLSPSPSRAERDTSGRKKPWHWVPLFSLLQMGANSSRTTPLNCIMEKLV